MYTGIYLHLCYMRYKNYMNWRGAHSISEQSASRKCNWPLYLLWLHSIKSLRHDFSEVFISFIFRAKIQTLKHLLYFLWTHSYKQIQTNTKLEVSSLFPQNIFYPISPLWSIQSLFVLIEFRFRIVLLLMYFVWHIYLYASSKSVLDGVTIKQTSASTSVPSKITR